MKSVLLRIAAACLVIAIAIGAKELLLKDSVEPTQMAGSRLVDFSVDSELLDGEQPVSVVVPPGAKQGKRSLVVFLHERGGDESSSLEEEMYGGLSAQGKDAPVVAFPAGGPDSYWHDRDDGMWGSYVSDELIPALVRRFEIEPERIALGGISMGGFGAYNIARRNPDLFCTVAGHSPAVWLNEGETAPGAFDDAGDFADNDVIEAVGPPSSPLAGKRVWVDVGNADPFLEADRALADSLRAGGARVRFREGEGGHENEYWQMLWPNYFRFYTDALVECAEAGQAPAGEEEDGSDRS